jgi:membrane protease YdiL (CAAX protease family)
MRAFAARRPLVFGSLLILFLQALVLAFLLISQVLGVPVVALDLPLMLANALVAVALLGMLGWWRDVGFNAPRHWRNLHLMLVPVLLLLGPTLLLQPQLPPLGKIAPLVVVTLLIGFQEEAIFRGVLLRLFAPRGVLWAVLVSAFLFGVIHANSFLVGRDPAFVVAQIVASFLGAIGLGALRLRIGTIWPLVLLHALNDFLQFSATGGIEAQQVAAYLPILKVGVSGLMALYGLYLLRGEIRRQPPRLLAREEASGASL